MKKPSCIKGKYLAHCLTPIAVVAAVGIPAKLGVVHEMTLARTLGLLFIFVCAAPSVNDLAKRRFDAGAPIHYFSAYLALSIGVRGLAVLAGGSYILSPVFDINSPVFTRLVIYAYAIAILGILAFLVGYYGPWERRLSLQTTIVNTSFSRRRIICSAMIAGVIGGAGFYLHVASLGGNLLRAIHQLSDTVTQQGGTQYLYFPMMWFWVAGFLTTWSLLISKGHSRPYLLFACFSLLVAILYLVTSSKWMVFSIVMSMFLSYHYLRRRMSPLLLLSILFIFAAMWPAFYAYQDIQGDFSMWWTSIQRKADQGWFTLVLGRSYGMDSFLLILSQVRGWQDLRLGSTLADALYFFVPRQLWDAKPVSFSRQFAVEFLGHTKIAESGFASPSLIGELYLNWHFVGVVGGMFLVGVLQRVSYFFVRRNQHDPSAVLLYAMTMLAFVHLVEGSISAQFELWLSWLIPTAVVHFPLWVRRAAVQQPSHTQASPASLTARLLGRIRNRRHIN